MDLYPFLGGGINNLFNITNIIFTMTQQINSVFDLRTYFKELRSQGAKPIFNQSKSDENRENRTITLSRHQQDIICNLVEEQLTLPINTKVEYLEMALKLCYIHIDTEILYQILDVLKLVNKKQGETALSDICELQKEWEQESSCKLEEDLEKSVHCH